MGWAMRTRFVVSGGWCQTKRRRELPSQRFPVFAAPTVALTLSAASLSPLLPSAAVSVLTSTRARTWVSPSAFLSGSASTWFCFPPRCVFPYPTSVRDGYLHAPSGLTKGLTLSLLSLQTYCRYLCWYRTCWHRTTQGTGTGGLCCPVCPKQKPGTGHTRTHHRPPGTSYYGTLAGGLHKPTT